LYDGFSFYKFQHYFDIIVDLRSESFRHKSVMVTSEYSKNVILSTLENGLWK